MKTWHKAAKAEGTKSEKNFNSIQYSFLLCAFVPLCLLANHWNQGRNHG